jgi:hypothetical protein
MSYRAARVCLLIYGGLEQGEKKEKLQFFLLFCKDGEPPSS